MAIRWMDNFSMYGSDEALMLNGLYAANSSILGSCALVDDPDPNITSTVLSHFGLGAGSGQTTRFVLPSTQATVGVALRLWMNHLPSDSAMSAVPIVFCDGSNVTLMSLWITTTGVIHMLRSGTTSGSTIVAQSTGPVLVANAWQHIEAKVFFSATVGTIEVRVDGVVVINATGLNTTAGPCAQIRQENDNNSTGGGIGWYIKDYIIWDGSGSENNNFVGSCSVVTLTPTSDSSFNWTASTGSTGFNLIDEVPPNEETDYISAADPPPAASTFGLSNLPVDVTSVKGLMSVVRARKTDGGDGKLQNSMVSAGVAGAGTDRAVTTSYTYWFDVFEVDPNTGSAWAPAAVDAATLKLNRTL